MGHKDHGQLVQQLKIRIQSGRKKNFITTQSLLIAVYYGIFRNIQECCILLNKIINAPLLTKGDSSGNLVIENVYRHISRQDSIKANFRHKAWRTRQVFWRAERSEDP